MMASSVPAPAVGPAAATEARTALQAESLVRRAATPLMGKVKQFSKAIPWRILVWTGGRTRDHSLSSNRNDGQRQKQD